MYLLLTLNVFLVLIVKLTLREKCPYLEFFWSVFSHIRTQYGPEKLRIRTPFTQSKTLLFYNFFREFEAIFCLTYAATQASSHSITRKDFEPESLLAKLLVCYENAQHEGCFHGSFLKFSE